MQPSPPYPGPRADAGSVRTLIPTTDTVRHRPYDRETWQSGNKEDCLCYVKGGSQKTVGFLRLLCPTVYCGSMGPRRVNIGTESDPFVATCELGSQ